LGKTDPETWKPTLKASKETNQSDKDQENEQFKIDYKAELDDALKRKRMYNDNLFKACALIWEICSKAMQRKFLPVKTMKMKLPMIWRERSIFGSHSK